MYCDSFGFREKPFTITPNPQFIFLSKNHKEAFAHLLYGIDNHAGFIELTGEVGTGKTTVLRTLLNQLDADSYRTALIFNPPLSALELLRGINREFGISSDQADNAGLLESLNRFLLQENAAGRTVVLVIDEAQNLEPQVLEQIRLISNLETEREKLIQIVLAGQPELREKLKGRELRQLSQRITVRYHLDPMDFRDTIEYVEHRVEVAAGRRLNIFTRRALRKIYRYSGGLPRLINVVCDRALLVAYSKGRGEVDAKIAAAAIADVRREGSGRLLRRIAGPAGITALAVLAYLAFSAFLQGDSFTGNNNDFSAANPAANRPQAAIPSSLELLKAELANRTEGESARDAYNAIARLWGAPLIDVPSGRASASDLEGLAAAGGLRLSRFNCGLEALLRLDYPAILELSLPPGGERRYLSLLGERGGRLVIAPPFPSRASISAADLEALWSGRSYLPWKNVLGIPVVNRRGARGDGIRNLRRLLQQAGFPSGALTDVYDEEAISAVRRFQKAQGLEPDGLVGSQTLLVLYRASGAASPPRLSKKGDS